MRILVTNDDGIHSEGLKTLVDALVSTDHEIWVAAPDSERSASSHALSLKTPVKFNKLSDKRYTCSGTPADCIFYGLKGAVPATFDAVVSGINRGFNVGTDIIYSGTVAAAREAALNGIPAIAISAEGFAPPFPFEDAAAFLVSQLEEFIDLWSEGSVININMPRIWEGDWDIAYPQQRDYGDRIEPYEVHHSEIYYFVTGGNSTSESFKACADSDMDLLSRHIVSVSPVHIHPVLDQKGADLMEAFREGQRRKRAR